MTTSEKKELARMDGPGEGNQHKTPTAMDKQAGSAPLIQPLPWHTREDVNIDGLAFVIDTNGFCVLREVTADEAAFIAKAANVHDELVAALNGLVKGSACACTRADHEAHRGAAIKCIWCAARTAIAKAEGH